MSTFKRKKRSTKSHSTQRSKPDVVVTTYSVQIRMNKIVQMLFEQQEHDNGFKAWMTTADIARDLGESMRSVTDALRRLRDDWDLPVHYVEKRKGVGFTEKVTSMPTMVCSQSESMGLCVAMLGLSIHAGTPYAAGPDRSPRN